MTGRPRESNGRLELTVADVPARVEERGGSPVIVTEGPMEPMSVAEARGAMLLEA